MGDQAQQEMQALKKQLEEEQAHLKRSGRILVGSSKLTGSARPIRLRLRKLVSVGR